MAPSEVPDDPDEDVDPHAADRDRRREKERGGMRVSGRSTRSLLPGLIMRRGREAAQRMPHHPHPPRDEDIDER
jgi:hypothetical protein